MPWLSLFLLHPVASLSWWRWSVHVSTVIGIAALAALYIWASRALRRTPTDAQKLWFGGGLLLIFASLNGPIHDLSDEYLFSAHMVQHMLLTLAIPPLLLAGTPGWMLRPILLRQGIRPVARFFTDAKTAFVAFNITLAIWHLPFFYNASMANHGIHIVEHLTFLAAAVLMWWPLLSQLPELPRLAYPGQMLYTFLTSLTMTIVAVYITFANHMLYSAYSAAPRVLPLTPLEDQLLGGLIMWIPGGMVFMVMMTVIFFKWNARGEDSTAAAQVDWKPTTT